jgi:hypothetical protein
VFNPDHWCTSICSPQCRAAKSPVVYCYTCPDGRKYVGAVLDSTHRFKNGFQRESAVLREAFKQYPPETWTYEILERLDPGCPEILLRVAEQLHINRLRTLDPKFGFNMNPAINLN